MTEEQVIAFIEKFNERLRKEIFPNFQVVDCEVIAELAAECLPEKEE